jgi:murein DD-endopeptidase MepM/ murein hydrolase activator NlpD
MKRKVISKVIGISVMFLMVGLMLGDLAGSQGGIINASPSQPSLSMGTVLSLNVGDIIEVQRDGVPLRPSPSTSDKEKRLLNKGEVWIIQGGPASAEGLTWWYVSIPPPYEKLDYLSYGWVAEVGKDGILNLKEKTNNNPPSKPTNQEPPNGATGVPLTPTLRASAFNDLDGESHLRTWWEVRKVADDSVVWDSGWRNYDLTSTAVPSGILQQNTQYKWRVRYMDSKGAWSPVSDFTQFTTGKVDNPPKVIAFDVAPRSTTLGNSFTISYTISDDEGLTRVELWRADDSNGNPVNWQKIKETSISGTSYSGSFFDAPTSRGSYWYGIHVVDTKGQWTTEPSPIKVTMDEVSVISEQPLLKAPWVGIAKISQGNKGTTSHYDHGIWDNTYAIDVALPVGSPVLAPADGVAVYVDNDPGGAGGKELAIEHTGSTGKKFTTVYLHLSEILVNKGEVVKQGQVIAKSGDTGDVTGPHLHFHIWSGIGSYDSHTIPIERLLMRQVGVDTNFREYDARKGELDDDKIAGKLFESPFSNQPPQTITTQTITVTTVSTVTTTTNVALTYTTTTYIAPITWTVTATLTRLTTIYSPTYTITESLTVTGFIIQESSTPHAFLGVTLTISLCILGLLFLSSRKRTCSLHGKMTKNFRGGGD